MQRSIGSLLVIFAAAAGAVHADDSALDRLHKTGDTSRFLFYDATEECKKTKTPCFTNMKYCDNSANASPLSKCPDNFKKDDMSWTENKEDIAWLRVRDEPAVLLGGAYETSDSRFELRWINTDPNYPTTIVWRPVIFTSQFYMYTVIEAGKTEWNFTLNDLADEMLPGAYVPSNASINEPGQYMLKNDLFKGVASAHPVYFAVAQPEKHEGLNPNESDTTSVFLYTDAVKGQLYDLETYAAEYTPSGSSSSQSKLDKKWQIGFGIGVGLGIPLTSALMFWLGQRSGMKHLLARKAGD